MAKECEFFHADEPEMVGRGIVSSIRGDLASADIRYIFRTEPEKKKGKTALATAQVVSGLKSALAASQDFVAGTVSRGEPFFLIQVWYSAWQRFSEEQKLALIDHELMHCVLEVDDNGEETYTTIGHDIEEFNAIVRRHGLWLADVREFIKAAEDHQRGQSPLLQVSK